MSKRRAVPVVLLAGLLGAAACGGKADSTKGGPDDNVSAANDQNGTTSGGAIGGQGQGPAGGGNEASGKSLEPNPGTPVNDTVPFRPGHTTAPGQPQ